MLDGLILNSLDLRLGLVSVVAFWVNLRAFPTF